MDEHRIRALRLLTAAPLVEMSRFYGETLGLPLEDVADDRLTVVAGETRVTFETAPADGGEPYYHFAFNIPENKILSARDWQAERSALVKTPSHMLDDGYPDDVRHFRNWNAHSVFFLDPAGNVVEYIARHELDNGRDGAFTSDDILYASEIAFAAEDPTATGRFLRETFSLDQYKNGSDEFRAIGDERGLLLVFEVGRMMIGDRDARVYPADVVIRGDTGRDVALPEFAQHRIRSA